MTVYRILPDGHRRGLRDGGVRAVGVAGSAGTAIEAVALGIVFALSASPSADAALVSEALEAKFELAASPSFVNEQTIALPVEFELEALPSAAAQAGADAQIEFEIGAQPSAIAYLQLGEVGVSFSLGASPSAISIAPIATNPLPLVVELSAQVSAVNTPTVIPSALPVESTLSAIPSAALLMQPATLPLTFGLSARVSISTAAKFRNYWLDAYANRQIVLNAIDANNRMLAKNAGDAAEAVADALVITNTSVEILEGELTAEAERSALLRASIGQSGDNLIRTSTFSPIGGRGTWQAGTVATADTPGRYALAITGTIYETAPTIGDPEGFFPVIGGDTIDGSFRSYTQQLTGSGALQFGLHSILADGSSAFQLIASRPAGEAGGYQSRSGRITLPATAVKARAYVFFINTSGTAYVMDLLARRVTQAESATATGLDSLQVTVTQQGDTITSQGLAITQVTATANAAATATELLEARVTATEDGVEQAQAIWGVYLDVNGRVIGVRSINDGVLGQFEVMADVFRLLSPAGADGMEIRDGYIRAWKGSSQTITGNNFGAPGQNLMRWFGPNIGADACTKANATSWEDSSGNAYFGGSLSAGVLKNAAQSTQISAAAQVETGPFGTNGNQKVVTYSLNYSNLGRWDTNLGTGPITATVVLERSYGGGAFAQVGTINITGQRVSTYDPEFGNYEVTLELGGSSTFTDNLAGGGTFNYRVRVTAASGWPFILNGGTFGTQRLSVISVES